MIRISAELQAESYRRCAESFTTPRPTRRHWRVDYLFRRRSRRNFEAVEVTSDAFNTTVGRFGGIAFISSTRLC